MRSAVLAVAGIAVALAVTVNGDCTLSSQVWHCQVTGVQIRGSRQDELRSERLPSLPAILSSQGRVRNSSPRKVRDPTGMCLRDEDNLGSQAQHIVIAHAAGVLCFSCAKSTFCHIPA
jgi:hypothetical protein